MQFISVIFEMWITYNWEIIYAFKLCCVCMHITVWLQIALFPWVKYNQIVYVYLILGLFFCGST